MLDMRRAAEKLLSSYLKMFPCVAVIGGRQCGKTTLVRTLPGTWKYYDLERRADQDVVTRDPDTFDVKRLFPGLDEVRFRRFVEMLGGLSGRTLNFADAARALAVSQPTARDYFEIAHGTFIWRHVPAYSRKVMKRAVKHPRGYVRDSGLLHSLLHIPELDALLSHPQAGASWEGMAVEEILRQLNALGVPYEYSYYRTAAGAEIDLVLEADFGRVAIEIKRTSSPNPRDLRGLRDFILEQKARFGIVINTDAAPRIYEEKIVGLPFNWL